ncbi:MAG: hypothetical protein LQ340_008010 [Diploschistes diacapsis]|nr:MAG: hypothetical protein LQ340_008010 [Diploschistes diacapsis]
MATFGTATDGAHKVEDLRKRRVGAIEVNDPHGRRRTIDVSNLNEADLALAEQFGYHPALFLCASPKRLSYAPTPQAPPPSALTKRTT